MRKRHKPEQIIRKLREADALLSGGATIADACRRLEVSEATYHRWRKQYSGMEIQALKRLKALEQENTRLKRIVADQVVGAIRSNQFWLFTDDLADDMIRRRHADIDAKATPEPRRHLIELMFGD